MSFPAEGQQIYHGAACDPGGTCIVVWDYGYSVSFFEDHDFLGGTTISSSGQLLARRTLRVDDGIALAQAVWDGKAFRVFWEKWFPDLNTRGERSPVFQRFDRLLKPKSALKRLPYRNFEFSGTNDAVRLPGGYALLSYGRVPPEEDSSLSVFFVGEQGQELRPPVQVSEDPASAAGTFRKGMAADAAGNIAVSFHRRDAPGSDDVDVFFRRFSRQGEPLGPDVRANHFVEGLQRFSAVTAAPGGRIVVVWQSENQDGDLEGIFGQRYSAQGVAVGPEFQVNNVSASAQRIPQVASDPFGNFLVVWQSFPIILGEPVRGWDVKARLFRANGAPVGDEILVNQALDHGQEIPDVTYAENGTFLIAWNGYHQAFSGSEEDVVVRRYSASPADELCISNPGLLRCDTGRTGRGPEGEHRFGGGGAGPAMLGDVDGDHRADPCDYTAGVFRCDTDHEGGAAEVRVPFTIPAGAGARPLLGDVDGDGDADPCLYAAGQFHCDSAHNGGAAEVVLRFAGEGEPLLGDLDGNGRDEPCFFHGGWFRCASAQAGSPVNIGFGKAGDQPLLGDWDGDGRDDPCVFRELFVMCDTAHDGGKPEASLRFGANGDRLLLGNLDGL